MEEAVIVTLNVSVAFCTFDMTFRYNILSRTLHNTTSYEKMSLN